jgi:hypothetical protein
MQKSARAYEDKGDAPLPLITSSARHAFPARQAAGYSAKSFDKRISPLDGEGEFGLFRGT